MKRLIHLPSETLSVRVLRWIFGVVVIVLVSWSGATSGDVQPGADVQKVTQLPIEELKTLASQGNADAMLELGERLIQGQGVDTNATEGLQWIQKAADAGKTQAWYDIGFVYSNGVGVKLDLAQAMKYFRKGAELGNSDCQTSLGLIYQAGERIPGGVKADPVEAVKWYRLAAEQGHTEAIQHLAMMYRMGQGVERNITEAIKWFRKGAELGNADCKWGLGQCYLDGKDVQQDSVQAYALFSAAIDGVENPGQKQAMAKKRDDLGKGLSADQLKRAESLVIEWKAKGKQ